MGTPFKPAVDRKGMSPEALKAYDALSAEEKLQYGVAHQRQCEAVPPLASYPHEKSITNRENYQNSGICFTRDRPGGYLSGYGGRGDTQCSAIDICVGYQAYKARAVNKEGEEVLVNPDFVRDAARIYISQKSDVDSNFFISPQASTEPLTPHKSKRPTSCIAIKADNVRIVARERIKLVTNTDTEMSQGGKVLSVGGIDLLAGNIVDSLQPFVLGDYLADALKQLTYHVSQLAGTVGVFVTEQKAFNDAVTNHNHQIGLHGILIAPSLGIKRPGRRCTNELQNSVLDGIKNVKDALEFFSNNYLEHSGDFYINSPFNRCN